MSLRRLFADYLTPLPVVLLFLTAGALLLWLARVEGDADARGEAVGGGRPAGRPGLRAAGRWLVSTGTVLLLLTSLGPFPRALLGTLEDDHAAYAPAAIGAAGAGPVRWIVVLCGGGRRVPGRPSLAGLSPGTLIRLAEGIRVGRLHPEARFLFTGGSPQPGPPCSEVVRGAALELGVSEARIVTEARSINTETEALAVERIIGREPFVLVTSAWHLPRATALMRARGLAPLPAPAGGGVPEGVGAFTDPLRPTGESVIAAERWAHEAIGALWARVRGNL